MIGDGENDLPMLEEVEHSIGINQQAKHMVITPLEAFEKLISIVEKYNREEK